MTDALITMVGMLCAYLGLLLILLPIVCLVDRMARDPGPAEDPEDEDRDVRTYCV